MTSEEWSLIVRQHSQLVWKTAYRLLVHHADATDCLQATFLQAWKFAKRQDVKNWPGLLQRLTTARALDELRSRQRRTQRRSSFDELDQLESTSEGPLAEVESMELADQLRKALAILPEVQSEVYCLRHLNDLSYEQIADEMGMSISAVGVNLHRATQRLRAALTQRNANDFSAEVNDAPGRNSAAE